MPTVDTNYPIGAPSYWKAYGFKTSAEGEAAFPAEIFQDELDAAELFLQRDYPCILTNGTLNLSGDDLWLYSQAVGFYAASLSAKYQGFAPGSGGPEMVKRKMLDTEYTFKMTDPKANAESWATIALDYMDVIGCVGGDAVTGIRAGLLQEAHTATDAYGVLRDQRGRAY